MPQQRRSSVRISLLLAGVTGLAGCGPDPNTQFRRDVYASIEDCKADWTRDQLCEKAPQASPGTSPGGTYYGGTYYYGPRYLWSRDWDSGSRAGGATGDAVHSGSRALSSITVERGGFGSSSWFHSAGG
jgi:uncharacterized protein YgiB involved in biofilm formation